MLKEILSLIVDSKKAFSTEICELMILISNLILIFLNSENVYFFF